MSIVLSKVQTQFSIPEEIMSEILDYTGDFKYRLGKWIRQIPKKATIYSLLLKKPKIELNEITTFYSSAYDSYDEVVESSIVRFCTIGPKPNTAWSACFGLHHIRGDSNYYFTFRIYKKYTANFVEYKYVM
jgi:hypothetical protein